VKHPSNHIFEHTPQTLAVWCEQQGMPRFRAKQILGWVYEKGVGDAQRMTDLSKRDRDVIEREMQFVSSSIVRHQGASDGTQKLLMQWKDYAQEGAGDAPASQSEASSPTSAVSLPQLSEAASAAGSLNQIKLDQTKQTECVMIPAQDRRTACISSQVGCPVGCKFCASGLGGLDHNLSAGRIVEQVWRLRELMGKMIAEGRGRELLPKQTEEPDVDDPSAGARESDEQPAAPGLLPFPRITNVVFMGMGEPLSNLAAVVPAIRTICSLDCLGISARKVTVSTVGLPKAIERLAEQLDLPVTLALSLHAPNDELRRELIPWAEYTTISDLLASCQKWFEKTGREITLEYTLLRGVNDRPQHAAELAKLAKTLRANVNVIRYNEVAGTPFARPLDQDVRAFQAALRDKNINAHIRASRGRDIAAACGQLRHETGNKARAKVAEGSQG
jgi:23S rRNA (adenine2503-C2)-methyltransferase